MNTRSTYGALVALSMSLSLCGVADAESFVCKDSEGHAYAGDQSPQECKDQEVEGLRSDGAHKRTIPAPVTRSSELSLSFSKSRALKDDEELAQR